MRVLPYRHTMACSWCQCQLCSGTAPLHCHASAANIRFRLRSPVPLPPLQLLCCLAHCRHPILAGRDADATDKQLEKVSCLPSIHQYLWAQSVATYGRQVSMLQAPLLLEVCSRTKGKQGSPLPVLPHTSCIAFTAGTLLQGTAAQKQLVELAQQYMIRRTSETLKQYLPAKVQEVSSGGGGRGPCPGQPGVCSKRGMQCIVMLIRPRGGPCASVCTVREAVPSAHVLPAPCWAHHTPCLPPCSAQVIFCKMSGLQHALYKGFLASEPVTGGGPCALCTKTGTTSLCKEGNAQRLPALKQLLRPLVPTRQPTLCGTALCHPAGSWQPAGSSQRREPAPSTP